MVLFSVFLGVLLSRRFGKSFSLAIDFLRFFITTCDVNPGKIQMQIFQHCMCRLGR